MMLSKAVLFGFLTSVVLIPGASASKTSLADEFIGEDSIFLYAALYKYSENEDTLGDDHEDPDIKVGMSQAEVVQEFARVGAANASFFEISVSNEELKKLLVAAPYLYGLYLNTSGLSNDSLEILKGFSELRFLDLTFNTIKTPTVEFFQSFPHLKEISLNDYLSPEKEAVEKLRAALPHVTFS